MFSNVAAPFAIKLLSRIIFKNMSTLLWHFKSFCAFFLEKNQFFKSNKNYKVDFEFNIYEMSADFKTLGILMKIKWKWRF